MSDTESDFYPTKRTKVDTLPITNYFPVVKKQAVRTVSEKLEGSDRLYRKRARKSSTQEEFSEEDDEIEYTEEELRSLLEIGSRKLEASVKHRTSPLEQPTPYGFFQLLGHNERLKVFHATSLKCLARLAQASSQTRRMMKVYVAASCFVQRFQRDYLDFINGRYKETWGDDYEESPFSELGRLLKSITIDLETTTRAIVFVNVCRNLFMRIGKLKYFDDVLEHMTKGWTYSEKRIMVKAAILIDPKLRDVIHQVMDSRPGELKNSENTMRNACRCLFVKFERAEPFHDEFYDFGAWTSILLRNFKPAYQARVLYVMFGPVAVREDGGHMIDWTKFCTNSEENDDMDYEDRLVRITLRPIARAVQALACLSCSGKKDVDVLWSLSDVYKLFRRVTHLVPGRFWSTTALTTWCCMDPEGILTAFSIYFLRDGTSEGLKKVANMLARCKLMLYLWMKKPSEDMEIALTESMNEMRRQDGFVIGPRYKSFHDTIWSVYHQRCQNFAKQSHAPGTNYLGAEMRSQSNIAGILTRHHMRWDNVRLREDEEFIFVAAPLL